MNTLSQEANIPDEFIGKWAPESQCSQYETFGTPGDGIEITRTEVNRYETPCKIAEVISKSATSLAAKLICQSEGEEYEESILVLKKKDGTLTANHLNNLKRCNKEQNITKKENDSKISLSSACGSITVKIPVELNKKTSDDTGDGQIIRIFSSEKSMLLVQCARITNASSEELIKQYSRYLLTGKEYNWRSDNYGIGYGYTTKKSESVLLNDSSWILNEKYSNLSGLHATQYLKKGEGKTGDIVPDQQLINIIFVTPDKNSFTESLSDHFGISITSQ